MHEMSLAEGVVQIVEDYARRENFRRVKTVWLEIGRLSGVETEAMRFCFEAATRDTVAEGAKLEMLETPGSAWCLQCSEPVAVQARHDACPRCGGYQLQVTGGTEMRVKELEVE
ncbi:MAG TPA: hydrogenase maturation nickel metallochaperone HypA [Burkholderiales bacterium]|nr:hydrogenase maturation nickel metallochaperone HypA [Burkholderiales bacterium]